LQPFSQNTKLLPPPPSFFFFFSFSKTLGSTNQHLKQQDTKQGKQNGPSLPQRFQISNPRIAIKPSKLTLGLSNNNPRNAHTKTHSKETKQGLN
jgi:hypothetical protein